MKTYVQKLLEKFAGVTEIGEGQWSAISPLRDEDSPSLRISLTEDGKILLRDFGGGLARDVLRSVGLDFRSLYPPVDSAPVTGKVETRDRVATQTPTLPAAAHDAVYRRFLGYLGLNEAHKKQLLGRGALLDEFFAKGYRSLSYLVTRRALKDLAQGPKTAAELLAAPGFRRGATDNTVIEAIYETGLLIPVTDLSGKIIAFQVRRDSGPSKYTWFGGAGSPSTGSPAHTTPAVEGTKKYVWVTEGPLKADLVAQFLDRRVIGVPGVATWRSAMPVIQALSPQKVVLAFDMDWRTKPSVAYQMLDLATALDRNGLDVYVATWEGHKGLDDYLYATGDSMFPIPRWSQIRDTVQRAATTRGTGVTVPTVHGEVTI